MKNFKKTMMIAAVAILFAACGNDNLPEKAALGELLQISVTAAGFSGDGVQTRASDAGYVTSFASGDRIGITAITGGSIVQNNIAFQYNGTVWNPVTPADIILAGADSYLVYYPYDAAMDGITSEADVVAAFTLKTNQSAQADYTESDLMTGSGAVSGTALNVTLTHALALVEVVLPAGFTNTALAVGGTAVQPYLFAANTCRYIAKPQAGVTLNGSCTTLAGTNMHWQQTGANLQAGQYVKVTVAASPGLLMEGVAAGTPVRMNFTSGENRTVDSYDTDAGIAFLPGESSLTVRSIQLNGGAEILIGRKADRQISLKFTGGNLDFRSGSPIPIGSYAEFQLINTKTGGLGGNYKQEADLDLMGYASGSWGGAGSVEWTAVGGTSRYFTGTYDGDGKSIANIYINQSGSDYQGLFGQVTTGTVKNVRIASGSIAGNDDVGGVVGHLIFSGTITGCSNNATVSGFRYVGGVAGMNGNSANNSQIIACYNTGNVSISYSIGGVAGANYSGTITACYWKDGTAPYYTGNGTDNSTGKFTTYFNPGDAGEWGTGTGTGSGTWWKPGIDYGSSLPKLWWE